MPDCLTIFFCSEKLGVSSFDEIKKGFITAFFNESNKNVGFHGLEVHIKEYLDDFEPSQGFLGDGSNHLSEFMFFVKQNPVRSCHGLALSYRSFRLLLLLFVLQYVFQSATAFNFCCRQKFLKHCYFFFCAEGGDNVSSDEFVCGGDFVCGDKARGIDMQDEASPKEGIENRRKICTWNCNAPWLRWQRRRLPCE